MKIAKKYVFLLKKKNWQSYMFLGGVPPEIGTSFVFLTQVFGQN